MKTKAENVKALALLRKSNIEMNWAEIFSMGQIGFNWHFASAFYNVSNFDSDSDLDCKKTEWTKSKLIKPMI